MQHLTAELQAVFACEVEEVIAVLLDILIEDLRVVVRRTYRNRAEGDGLRSVDRKVLPLEVAEVGVHIVDHPGADGAVPVSKYGVVVARGIVGGTWICGASSQGVVILEGEAVDASEDAVLAARLVVDAAEILVDGECLGKDQVSRAAREQRRIGDAAGLVLSLIGAVIPKLFFT